MSKAKDKLQITDAIEQMMAAQQRHREALSNLLACEYRIRQMLGIWQESEEVAIPDGKDGFYLYDPWPQLPLTPMQGELRHTSAMTPEYPSDGTIAT